MNDPGWTEADYADGLAETEKASKGWQKDGRLCLCGHPAKAHASVSTSDDPVVQAAKNEGIERCKFARMVCPCKAFTPAVSVDDPRVGMFKTQGPGAKHALQKAVSKARDKGQTVEWDPDVLHCMYPPGCTEEHPGKLSIANVNPHTRRVSTWAEGYNLMLCEKHYQELGGTVVEHDRH